MPGLGINLQILFQDDDADGEVCRNCKQEIKGKKWVMMLQIGDATNAKPMDYILCTLCKLQWDKDDAIK